MSRKSFRKVSLSALLPAVAVVVPAALLAVLGWRAYRAEALLLRDRFERDQAGIVRLVGARLSEEARKAAHDLRDQVRHRAPDHQLEASFVAAYPLARHVFVVRAGQLVYPASMGPAGFEDRDHEMLLSWFDADARDYINRLRVVRRLRALVAHGLRAEYAGRPAEALRFYRRAAASSAPPAARALLGRARVERQLRRPRAALDAYASLRRRFGTLPDREGISYGLLADVGRVSLVPDPEALLLRIHQRLRHGQYGTSPASRRFYLRWVLEQLEQRFERDGDRTATSRPATRPAMSTAVGPAAGRPLDGRGSRSASALRGVVDAELLQQIRQRTAALFASDHFGRVLRRYGIGDRQVAAAEGVSALAIAPRTTLVLARDGDLLVGYELAEDTLRQRVSAQQKKLVSGESIRLTLRRPGERLSVEQREQVVHAAALDRPLGHWTLVAWRSAADPLTGLERRGQLRHFGMVAGLILVLAAGLVFTYRGVRRESELARLKSDFASNVSHELKTPLTSIRMYAEMLQQNIAATVQDQQRYHEVIIREAERLGRLIANVLDFSRIERGTRSYDLGPEDLRRLTTEAVATFRRLAAEEAATVTFASELVEVEGPAAAGQQGDGAGASSLPIVNADREAAIQSVLNLLSNASKYSPDDHQILVRLLRGRGGGWFGVEVTDHGIGISSAEQKRIFDDFYRAPQAREVGVEGTGLGLALVRRHMAAYGGKVAVRSSVGRGSSFTLWFRGAGGEAVEQEAGLGEDTGH